MIKACVIFGIHASVVFEYRVRHIFGDIADVFCEVNVHDAFEINAHNVVNFFTMITAEIRKANAFVCGFSSRYTSASILAEFYRTTFHDVGCSCGSLSGDG